MTAQAILFNILLEQSYLACAHSVIRGFLFVYILGISLTCTSVFHFCFCLFVLFLSPLKSKLSSLNIWFMFVPRKTSEENVYDWHCMIEDSLLSHTVGPHGF